MSIARLSARVVLFALVLCGVSLGGGCVRDESDTTRLSVALSGSPETLDPHATTSTLTFQVVRSLYDTLVEPGHDGIVVPSLAEEWQFTDDVRQLHLQLRRGVRFHNGDALTTADVAATLGRLQSSDSPRAADYANIERIEVVDAYRLILHLAQPQSSLLATLASGWSAILPQKLIDARHDFATMPVGSGPFAFSEWRMGSRISMVRNDNYWKETAGGVTQVDFHIITENLVRVQGLLQGTIDVVDIIDPVDLAMLVEDDTISVDRSLSSLTMVVAINTARPPLDDLRLRQAISHAIDKQRVLDEAYGGGVPITTFLDRSDFYYPAIPERYGYDPDAARRLLAQIGDALPTTPLVITVPQNFEPHIRAAELYQQMLDAVGLASELELIDWPTWISRVYTDADYQLTVIGHTGHLDPSPRFGEYAYTRFTDPEIPALLAAAIGEKSEARRAELYAQVFGIFADALPFVFVGTNYRYVVTRAAVSGVAVDIRLDTFDFRDVVKK